MHFLNHECSIDMIFSEFWKFELQDESEKFEIEQDFDTFLLFIRKKLIDSEPRKIRNV